EDGIRDGHVTGVQTCALPIWVLHDHDHDVIDSLHHYLPGIREDSSANELHFQDGGHAGQTRPARMGICWQEPGENEWHDLYRQQIGRASCRERVEISERTCGQ